MKKKILTFALAIAAILSPALATAQTETTNQDNTPKKEKIERKGGKDRKGGKEMRRADMQDGRKGNPMLRGIELTDTQATQIEALDQQRNDQMQQIRTAAEEQMKQADQQYQENISKILTPEQLTQFNANMEKYNRVREVKGQGFGQEFRSRDGQRMEMRLQDRKQKCDNPTECKKAKEAKSTETTVKE